ncbi:MAG TPA: M48 family metallopeptidase [Nevskiaceae bacterium]|nr:M48 family metallopeptidase [Nevskiaceae bacterium]
MIPATYYDGRSATRRAATLQVDGDALRIVLEGSERIVPLAQAQISERLRGAPRTLHFADGASCDVDESPELDALLSQAGHSAGRVERWQRSWTITLASLAALAILATVGYRFGLPVLASYAADRMPSAIAQRISSRALASLDQSFLKPSALSPAHQKRILDGFAKLKDPEDDSAVVIDLRDGGELGPNAFTLPDGTIVLLDALVKLADDDEQIYAVLAHERGHAHYRHGLRAMLQTSAIGVVLYLWVGDANTLLAVVPTAALQARYSRAFEADADAYAARMMRANGIAPSRLAEMLEKLEAWLRAKHPGATEASARAGFLRTHPTTPERIEALKQVQ